MATPHASIIDRINYQIPILAADNQARLVLFPVHPGSGQLGVGYRLILASRSYVCADEPVYKEMTKPPHLILQEFVGNCAQLAFEWKVYRHSGLWC